MPPIDDQDEMRMRLRQLVGGVTAQRQPLLEMMIAKAQTAGPVSEVNDAFVRAVAVDEVLRCSNRDVLAELCAVASAPAFAQT